MPFNLEQYVATVFPEAKRSGDERVVTCFYCLGKSKLYINVIKRKFYCFRCGAGQGASLVSLIRDRQGLSERDAWEVIRSNRYQGYQVQSYGELFHARQEKQEPATVLPEDYEPLYPRESLEGSVLAPRAITYLRKRGLTDADFMLYRLGYCAGGRYRGRIIVPVLKDGEVVYFIARLFFGYGQRYLNPKNEEIQEHPSNLLFNWDLAKGSETLRICEGVFDAIGLGDDVTALFGKRIHPGQLQLMESGHFTRIELWLDSKEKDPAITRDEDRLAFQLRETGKPITICSLERGDPSETRTQEIPVTRREGGSWAAFFGSKGLQR